MEVLYSILVLLGLALLFSILLAYLGSKLAVPIDEKQQYITSLLTGANCGGCGYAGCSDFAKALCEGKADVSDCSSTPRVKKALIADCLGTAASGGDIKFVVACCGGNNCADKYDYQGYGDCQSMNLLAGGKKACPVGCMGTGSCTKVCPTGAVDITDGGCAKIGDNCQLCGLCKKACPKGLIVEIPADAAVYVACSSHQTGKEVRAVCKSGCIGCGICVKTCPEKAIALDNNLAVIDYSKCVKCGACVAKCPTKVLKFLEPTKNA